MASASPSPDSPSPAVPPPSSFTPPPSDLTIVPPQSPAQPPSAPPPDPPLTSRPSLPNASAPDASTTPSPPSPPSPTPAQSPPPLAPPPSNPPPPQVPTNAPPPSSPPPPSQPDPPMSSPPPPPPEPVTPPPAAPVVPPLLPPPPPQHVGKPPLPPPNPPTSLPPPPPTPKPPQGAPPPSPSKPPESSPPPPPPKSPSSPPESSPPPPPPLTPAPVSPEKSPPPTKSVPPPSPAPLIKSPPPPQPSPSPPRSPPALSPPTSRQSPPSPTLSMSPPPPSANSPTMSPPPSPAGNGGMGTAGVIAIGVAVGIIILSIIGFAVCCMRKRRKEVSGLNGVIVMPSSLSSPPTSDSAAVKIHSSAPLIGSSVGSDVVFSPKQPSGIGHSRSWFEYEELIKATDGFSDENLLGEGGFGSVYKGCLPDGRLVAVKQLRVGGKQGEREFKAEVEIISRIHHRHLVSLVGYCIAHSRRLLVYDYVPNNTLYFHLHGADRPALDWATRVKIAAGAARGIAYLHEDCHPRVFHRDIKSSNILLDNNFEARVSDFGLAKLAFDADTHITTRVMGTFGYMAPEYATSGKLTEKSDVYSYGVVLLELITGRKPVDASQPLGDESLVEWARPLLSHALESEEFESLADPRLERNYVESEMFHMIEAAASCVRHAAAKRPRMGQIVRAFDSLAATDLMNGMRLGESEVFDSAEQSAEIRLFRRMAFGSQNYSTDFFSRGSSNGQNSA